MSDQFVHMLCLFLGVVAVYSTWHNYVRLLRYRYIYSLLKIQKSVILYKNEHKSANVLVYDYTMNVLSDLLRQSDVLSFRYVQIRKHLAVDHDKRIEFINKYESKVLLSEPIERRQKYTEFLHDIRKATGLFLIFTSPYLAASVVKDLIAGMLIRYLQSRDEIVELKSSPAVVYNLIDNPRTRYAVAV